MATKTETVAGSVAAKELGLALAQIYNYIRTGKVTNHKADGWPTGKGIEVDLEEVRAAMSTPRAPRSSAPRAPREAKSTRKARQEAIHEALDAEAEEKRARKRATDDGNVVYRKRYERSERLPVCPVDADHGSVAKLDPGKGKNQTPKFWCPNQSHDGRGKGHPAGAAPATKNVFTEDELQTPAPIGALGEIMLGWIVSGQTDLAEDMETWMTKHGLPVWIPVR